MSTQNHCPACGTAVAPGQPFCPRCGAGLPAPAGQRNDPPAAPVSPAGSRPWPFSAELLAQYLATQPGLAKPVVDALLAEASSSGRSFPDLIIERRQLTPEALRDAMSRAFGLPIADLRSPQIDPTLVANFPSDFARSHLFLPLHREDTRLLMVVADPTQATAVREVKNLLRLTIDLRLATPGDLAPVVHQYFSPTLAVLMPAGETLTVPIPPRDLKIGKADHNDVVLPDPAVSGTHAVVRHVGAEYQIVDLASRNGVFVDNVRIDGARTLHNGDVITIGQCLLTFKLPVPDAAQSPEGGTQILMPGQIPNALGGIRPVASAQLPTPLPTPNPQVLIPNDLAVEDNEKKNKKKKKKDKAKENEKVKSAWIGFVGRIIAQIVGALATIILGLAVAGKLPTSCLTHSENKKKDQPPAGVETVVANPFGETNAETGAPFNASGVVAAADSKFYFVENNTNEAIFQLTLTPEGAKAGPLVKLPLRGLAKGTVDDMEGLTIAEENGKRYLFAATSMMTRVRKKVDETPPSGLVRIVVNPDGTLDAQNMADFRAWFVKNDPNVGASAILEPDDGGLNVEGLAWDPKRHALLLGVRTPVIGGKPFVVPVRVKDLAGPWDTSNLELLPPIQLSVDGGGEEQGIRSIEYDPSRQAFLVMVGNSTSGPMGSNAPFQLYMWDGGDTGAAQRLANMFFSPKMKPEGVTHGTVGGRGALVLVDDAGGYQVIFDDDPRMK